MLMSVFENGKPFTWFWFLMRCYYLRKEKRIKGQRNSSIYCSNACSMFQAKKNLDAARHIKSWSGFHSLDNTVGRQTLSASATHLCIKEVIKSEHSIAQNTAKHSTVRSPLLQYYKFQEIPKTHWVLQGGVFLMQKLGIIWLGF